MKWHVIVDLSIEANQANEKGLTEIESAIKKIDLAYEALGEIHLNLRNDDVGEVKVSQVNIAVGREKSREQVNQPDATPSKRL